MRSAIATGLILYVAIPYFKLALGLTLLIAAPFFVLFAAIEWIQRLFEPTQDFPSASHRVHVSNKPSQALFHSRGYVLEDESGEWQRWRKVLSVPQPGS